ncbi:iduronate 2-sulfatase [Cephus cinctus]|uniref:Iduronate 2-sulfatase n=1 Tax=Cephus cinctus TaxID=211228 RepID=A0AAJ7BWH2_CEPCN|nr:iduronate 2-sulfatase [Cephus cinctus]
MLIQLLLMNSMASVALGRPNFLLIVVDDLRTALGCYGDKNAYTPNIDKLAEQGVVFSQAFAQQSLCAPSRNSFLTGRRPDTLQLYDFYSYWRETVGNFTTLPEHLKNNGYTSVSIGKIFHPGISSNGSDDYPYSWSREPFHPYTNRYKDAPVCSRNGSNSTEAARNLVCPVCLSNMPNGTLPDIETLNVARNFLHQQHHQSPPFLLAVGFQKPHIPLKYPQQYLKHHPLKKFRNLPNYYAWPRNLSSVAYNPWTDLRKREDVESLLLKFPWEKIPVSFARTIIQSYYAAISYIDDLVGLLMEQLTTSSIQKKTIVILTSDHGWSLGEHAEWAKYSNFDVAVHVPLIVSIPSLMFAKYTKNSIRKERNTQINSELRATVEKSPDPIRKFRYASIESMLRKNRGQSRDIRGNAHVRHVESKKVKGVPKIQNKYTTIDSLVELVDVFPTIAELAGVPIPICPKTEYHMGHRKVSTSLSNVCAEGVSFLPLIIRAAGAYQVQNLRWKKAAFSQYPRPGVIPTVKPNSDEPKLNEIKIMGYTVRTNKYRYTAWVKFAHVSKKPQWKEVLAEELYEHDGDPDENINLANFTSFLKRKAQLKTLLIRGWRHALPERLQLQS